jgi:hypothetical protein
MAQLERPTAASDSGSRERYPVAISIGKVAPQERVAVTGVISAATPMSISGCPACRCTLTDDTGQVDLMFLGRVVIPGLEPGRHCSAEGTAAARDGRIVIWNPRYTLLAG